MSRIWLRVIKNHKIVAQAERLSAFNDTQDNFTELLGELDIPRPMWLKKHENEYESFRRTRFTKEHFIEDVAFDSLELEFLEDTGKKRKSLDPRNDFS